MRTNLKILLELGKVRIASMSVLSVFAGYVLAAGTVDWGVLEAAFGVFLLASGASSLNQYQERDLDGLMERTKNRPIPSGRVTPGFVLVASAVMIVCGAAALAREPVAVGLGLLTVAWYNGVYTPLKRVTAFAAVPGGVVGALPPVIGWVCGGGSVFDPRIFAVSFFFFVWQIPHFWLLLLRTGEDYERAGLPTLTSVFTRPQLSRVTFVWMLAAAVSCIVFPLFGVFQSAWIYAGVLLSSVWLAWHALRMLRTHGGRLAFKEINIYALLIISLLSISGMQN
jgi:protoheme IX farnesyltransferase